MDNIELVKNFEYLGERHRFRYHEFANLIEWQQLVELNWWQRLFRTDGQDRIWKRIYFGSAIPVEKCLETYKRGQAARNWNTKK